VDSLDPTLFERDDVRAALAARDIGAVYRLLGQAGVSQRRIAQLTGQSQSEVCEILKGRQVRDVWVLERIADGLGVPRAWMGLSYGEEGPDTPSADEGDEDVKRRALIAATTVAGLTLVRRHPNDALKLFQLGQLHLGSFRPRKSTLATPRADDSWIPTVTARLGRGCAKAYAVMGGPDEAIRCLAEARDGWAPRDAFERAGADFVTAGVQLDLGRFDAAEQLAASAVRTYGEHHRRDRTQAELLLAEVHVRAGEPCGLTLAREAIEKVPLQSVAARRQRLVPLATALGARPGSDTRELARRARQIATTRI
jgi:transcriptional regulator with XRE-family HTH domain